MLEKVVTEITRIKQVYEILEYAKHTNIIGKPGKEINYIFTIFEAAATTVGTKFNEKN